MQITLIEGPHTMLGPYHIKFKLIFDLDVIILILWMRNQVQRGKD